MGERTDILWKSEAIKKAYNGSPTWRDKVTKMSDAQIIAVYLRLKQNNQI